MTIKWSYNVGVFGKTIQTTLYNYKNEGLRLYSKAKASRVSNCVNNSIPSSNKKTSKEKKIMADDETPKRKIIDVEAWMNTGGKGFFVKIDGKEYITSIESVQALLNGEKQGVKLGLLEDEE